MVSGKFFRILRYKEIVRINIYIYNFQCVDLIGSFYNKNDLEGVVGFLLAETYQRWKLIDSTIMDDITFIIIFLSYI